MEDEKLQALANELAKNLKTSQDLNQFDRLLKKQLKSATSPCKGYT